MNINRNRAKLRKMEVNVPTRKEEVSFMNPFQPLPNVREFAIGEGSLDLLMRRFGIKKVVRVSPLYKKYDNGASNRYMNHQVRRMNEALERKDLFWTIAMQCIKRSNVFLVIGLNHIIPQGHRKESMKGVGKAISGYKKLVRENGNDIDYRRVYILKDTGKYRPLGVPTTPGRIYLHLLNQFLCIYLQRQQPRNQHGFGPKRSTTTAGDQIMSEALDAKDIYEFDLKGYFDNIEIQSISKVLRQMKLPEWLVYHIENLNKSTPKLEADDKIEELKREVDDLTKCLYTETVPKKGKGYEPVKDFITANGEEMWEFLLQEEVGQLYSGWELKSKRLLCELKYVEQQGAILSSLTGDEKFHAVFKGVPQGAPTSPLLSTLVLKDFLEQDLVRIVQYADDGILYSNVGNSDVASKMDQIFSPITKIGVEVNWEKSGGIKRDGKGLKSLKFLGLEYDPFREVGRAKTRKGSVLEYDKHLLVKAVAIRDLDSERAINDILKEASYELDKQDGPVGEDGLRSKIKGYIISRMYAGSGDLKDFTQDFSYTFVKNSGSQFRGHKSDDLNIFNSSSIAARSLTNALRTRGQYRATRAA